MQNILPLPIHLLLFAGPDQTITPANKFGEFISSGTDPDGNITAYQWTKLPDPQPVPSPHRPRRPLPLPALLRVHTAELRVTDNGGAFGRDTMQVIVNAAPNIPPTANAAPDQTITLPTSTATTLSSSGTDPDGNISLSMDKDRRTTAGTITARSSRHNSYRAGSGYISFQITRNG